MRRGFLWAMLLLAGCKSEARTTFEAMNGAACAGDAGKFFAYVDEDKLIENVLKRMDLSKQAGNMGLVNNAREILLAGVRKSVNDEWRRSITEDGKSGDVCGWAYVSDEKLSDQQRVVLKSRAGNTKHMYFAKEGEGMKLVDFEAIAAK